MSDDFVLNAEERKDVGKGASRRLRRLQDLVPAIIYGGKGEPRNISLPLNELKHSLGSEAFFSHILTINVGKDKEEVVLRDLQRNPINGFPIHCDFMRIVRGQKMTTTVPLHFEGEETAPGVKLEGGKFMHNISEVEITCLPRNLPEYIAVDVSEMKLDEVIHMSELKLPKGVELVELQHGEEHDQPVVAIHVPKRQPIEEEETEEAAEEAEGEEAKADEEGGEDADGEEDGDKE
jgi:large subunit ribosomal protein L25